jgi:ATP-dependent helicase HrpA
MTTDVSDPARLDRRRASVPAVSYPEALPVSQRRDDILAAIRDHQIVIIAGETGSGKTTQLPKICLELGRGIAGMIGHTQPRRLAARTVAERIAEELDTPLGGAIGYQVRFTGQVGADTLVKVMTDGILLAEIQQDRLLRRYDTLIIDEAHERSLNVDFLLGYLKQLLPRRPDLKVVITSATIETDRFARHFAGPDGEPAPVIEVSGRTYPVEVRYRPIDPEDPDRDQTQSIVDAVHELRAEPPGDILVFLSGEREIRDTAEALERERLPATEVLPLYARLSMAEQHRVFAPHPGRRIVLATNVAETSLTVPGIRYVIDPGTARISRYSNRTKVQRLPIERVSQASANQRKGRCGRIADGICIRLYDEADFLSRPEFTDPEILRTNLASVILQMTAAGLGDIAEFPFMDPPDRRNIQDGVALLTELGALSEDRRQLTPLGRRLARLPIDPRLARMVLAAERNGCVREVLVVAAALSIQDPRERPSDKQAQADQAHARFADPDSDFLAYLSLWRYLQQQQKALSGNQFRRLCRAEFLNYLRVREWQDLESQLRQVVKGMGVSLPPPADAVEPARIHQSLLAGLLSHVGLKDPTGREYLGARGAKFAVFPGSALARRPPRWVMAAELVETSRLWARINARIEPEWVEELAGHLVKRSYSEPHWERKQAAVVAYEKVTLFGIPIVVSRKVNYGRIDPALSRELFIRHALVEGDWQTHHAFFHDNRRLLAEAEELEHRARRRDIVVDDEALYGFYDQRVPAEVVSGRHFDSWWKKTRRDRPDLLSFSASMLVNPSASTVDPRDFPDRWPGTSFALSYEFSPGSTVDGVAVDVPIAALAPLSPDPFGWQVPGLREELVTALIRSLPKAIRREFAPAPDHARDALARLAPYTEPLLDGLERELHRMTGVAVPRSAWDLSRVPDHLRPTFRVLGEDGATLASGKDLLGLKESLRDESRAAVSAAAGGIERTGLTDWTIGTLPRTVTGERGGFRVTAYPALVDEGGSVAVRLFDSVADADFAMWRGTRRLLALTVPAPVKPLQARLSNEARLVLTRNPHGSVGALLDDCVAAAVDALIAEAGGPAWSEEAFAALRERVRAGLGRTLVEVVDVVGPVLAAAHEASTRLGSMRNPAWLASLADVRAQLAALVYPGFVADTGLARLGEMPRYLAAVARRLDRLAENPARDRERTEAVAQVQREYRELLDQVPPGHPVPDGLRDVRWMLEELRVNYFAQSLGTPYPISDKRIYRALDDLSV